MLLEVSATTIIISAGGTVIILSLALVGYFARWMVNHFQTQLTKIFEEIGDFDVKLGKQETLLKSVDVKIKSNCQKIIDQNKVIAKMKEDFHRCQLASARNNNKKEK